MKILCLSFKRQFPISLNSFFPLPRYVSYCAIPKMPLEKVDVCSPSGDDFLNNGKCTPRNIKPNEKKKKERG